MENLQTSQLAQYIPILFLLAAAVGFAGGTLGVSVLLGKFAKSNKAKDTAYECGKDPIGEGTGRFSVKFYLVAMLFILFDIETIFLFPVAVQLKAFGTFALVELGVFIVLLFVAFVYVWRRGALEWK